MVLPAGLGEEQELNRIKAKERQEFEAALAKRPAYLDAPPESLDDRFARVVQSAHYAFNHPSVLYLTRRAQI